MEQKNRLKIFKMTFIVSEKNTPNGLLLVVTDKIIMGEIFEEGKLQLDLTKKFYAGEEKNKEEVKELITKSRHIHFTGKEAVNLGIELNLINSNKIILVQNMPHAEVVMG